MSEPKKGKEWITYVIVAVVAGLLTWYVIDKTKYKPPKPTEDQKEAVKQAEKTIKEEDDKIEEYYENIIDNLKQTKKQNEKIDKVYRRDLTSDELHKRMQGANRRYRLWIAKRDSIELREGDQ